LRHPQGEIFPLDPEINEFLVGRPDPASGINPEINLSGVDPTRSLSRRHAKLVRQGQLYFVREETGTINGTYVNNVRVTTGVDVPIKPGDKLRFGAVEVDFAAA
jgi:pSer/pThr/pTyr-binding forkhead associated (FHA) protein